MKRFLTLCLLVSLFSACAADEKEKSAFPSPEEMMKKMMELATPGSEHKQLHAMVGDWTCEVTEYPMFPGMKETKSAGKATFTSVMDGRAVQQKFESNFNGMDYKGMGFMGYDNAKKVYYSTWMDNMSTSFMYAEGTMDEATKTITETAETHCPMGIMQTKLVTTMKSEDEFVFVMHGQPEGMPKMQKMMQIVYKRSK